MPSSRVSVRIVRDNSAAVAAAINGRLAGVVSRTAETVAQNAQAITPVRTGELRGSIDARQTSDPLRAEVVALALYALYVEMGTSRQVAQPILLPALMSARAYFLIACERAANLR